ncbi:MAG TPA: ABC transporter permease [Bacteroidetes bacterium]|nr:ABC transporter permease [Bacteroidota bacterium]
MKLKDQYWDTILSNKQPFFQLKLGEVWQSRDLLWLFTKRDIAQLYKQTILGPLWFFIQPLLATIVFTIVFGGMAGMPTDGIPPMLFYLSGQIFWMFFAETLNKSSTTFRDNQAIFGKVYFARLIVPLSIVINSAIKFGIQFFLFLIFYFFFQFVMGAEIHPKAPLLLLPVLLLMTGALGMGVGLIITSMTTKYRDLTFLVTFGVQLLMFLTPSVIVPVSEFYKKYPAIAPYVVGLNPLTAIIETFKYGFLGEGAFTWPYFITSIIMTIIIFLTGVLFFNKTEKNFMDVI